MSTMGQSYLQAIKDFGNLNIKLKDLNVKMNYPVTDKRHGALQSLLKICMWNIMEIVDFVPHLQDSSNMMNRFGLSKEDSIQFGMSIYVYQRAAFLTLFMFQVENLLKMIRNNLPGLSQSDKYYDITKDILSVTHSTDLQQKQEILRCPAMIRNCLHSSGIHTKRSEPLQIGGINFDFVQNQMFNSAGWDSISFLIDKLVDVLEEILTHSDVKKLTISKTN